MWASDASGILAVAIYLRSPTLVVSPRAGGKRLAGTLQRTKRKSPKVFFSPKIFATWFLWIATLIWRMLLVFTRVRGFFWLSRAVKETFQDSTEYPGRTEPIAHCCTLKQYRIGYSTGNLISKTKANMGSWRSFQYEEPVIHLTWKGTHEIRIGHVIDEIL